MSIARWLRIVLGAALILALAGGAPALAQKAGQSAAPKEKKPEILDMLGRTKLEHFKKGMPGGAEARAKPRPGSRLDALKVMTVYQAPDAKAAYYFNRQGILVSAAVKAAKPLTKEQLLREYPGLKFQKYPPQQTEAASFRRTPKIVQWFFLSQDGKYVEITAFDYLPQ